LRIDAYMIFKLVHPLEDRIAIHRFVRAPLVFSSSSLKQHSMASPPL